MKFLEPKGTYSSTLFSVELLLLLFVYLNQFYAHFHSTDQFSIPENCSKKDKFPINPDIVADKFNLITKKGELNFYAASF
jgi:hypothetical protein